VWLFRCEDASPEIPEISPEIPDFPETPEKSPEIPGFSDKIVLSGDFQDSPIHPPSRRHQDPFTIFANPDRNELHRLSQILNFFGNCSGLRVNLNKTEVFPIRCDETTVTEALIDFPGKIGKFHGKYLGLPLHTRQLRRVDVQPLLDKIGGRIPGWKGKLLSMADRETLVMCVLTSQPIYHLTVFLMQTWLLKQIDKLRPN
jgi:hypothetical protein